MRHRLTSKIIIPFLAAAVMFTGSLPVYGEPPAETERFGTARWYSTLNAGSTVTDSFYYSDEWFLEDPEVQNDALALVSMQLTAAAVENDENGAGTEFLEKLGFEQTGLAGFDNEDPQGCNFTGGTKTIEADGDVFTLAAVVIQSHSRDQSVKQTGWRQNFLVNGETAAPEHASYSAAADSAAAEIARLGISGKVKYWVMGQSRGGAIAGALAVRLTDNADAVYAYTFESPANVELSAVPDNAQEYGFIHNYICSDDIVTMIPPWDMTRYGTEHLLNTDEAASQLPLILDKMEGEAAGVPEDYDKGTIENLAKSLIQALSGRIPSREDYSLIQTDIFADKSGNEVHVTYSWQDVLTGLMQVVFGNVFEGIDTGRLADELFGLLPAISYLYSAVKEESDSDYYAAASVLADVLEKVGIQLPVGMEDIYVLLKLAGPVMVNPDFVPESDEITEDEMISVISPVLELFDNKDNLIFSHQFDTIIARLKAMAQEPALENLAYIVTEPSAGDETASLSDQAQASFNDPDCPWLSVSAEWETEDKQFLDDKVYYLHADISSAGHSIPDDFNVTVNGKEPEEPPEITYADGITLIKGTWESVLGTPGQVSVSFDSEGHGETPVTQYILAGEKLKYVLSADSPEIVTDSSGTYAFDGWYDEDGNFWEDICPGEDITLHARWHRVIANIEIIFDIPDVGEEALMPEIPDDAGYRITNAHLADAEWADVSVVSSPGEYILDFDILPVYENISFLTEQDEDGSDIYAGVLTVNGEETDVWYDSDENCISVSYYFTSGQNMIN